MTETTQIKAKKNDLSKCCIHEAHKGQENPPRASFNYFGITKPIYCGDHKKESMVNVNNKKCAFIDNNGVKCGKVPVFNFPDKKVGLYCAADKLPGMIDVTKPPCEICGKSHPSFNFPGKNNGIRCADHPEPGMIDVKHKKCEKCNKLAPSYNYPGETIAKFCAKDAEEGMIRVVGKMCESCNKKRPIFNYPTEQSGIRCKACILPGMINLERLICINEDCDDSASYNIKGQYPRYCKECATSDMVNTRDKFCQHIFEDGAECTKHPSFNIIGQKTLLFCADHKTPNMVNIKHPNCTHPKCQRKASHGFENIKKPIFCSFHAIADTIDLKHIYCDCGELAYYNLPEQRSPLYCGLCKTTEMVKVINISKPCKHPSCTITPKFNYPGETERLFCNRDKLPGMVNLDNKITECIYGFCDNIPLFNDPKKKAIYCSIHKLPTMINLELSKKCSSENCIYPPITSLNDIYYCLNHYPDKAAVSIHRNECSICDLAPNNLICSNCKEQKHRKEWETVCYLKRKINLKPILDSNEPVKECSKRRPDIFYDCSEHVVIVEVDEDQHRKYLHECECARISEIVGSIGGKSVTVIRYNPDKIKNNGKEIVIPKSERLEKLVEITKHELNLTQHNFQVKLIQLFYDDNYENYLPYKLEDITDIVAF